MSKPELQQFQFHAGDRVNLHIESKSRVRLRIETMAGTVIECTVAPHSILSAVSGGDVALFNVAIDDVDEADEPDISPKVMN